MLKISFFRIKQIASNKLAKSFATLGIIQSANLLIPLMLTPYLIKTTGISNYGKIVFSQSVMLTLNILVEYGFNLSATRSISINRTDPQKINEIYSATYGAKLLLICGAFIIFCMFLPVSIFGENYKILFLSFSILLGQLLTPIWAFQGLEKISTYAVINIIFKTLYIAAVFTFLTKPGQYVYANLFLGISGILTGICSIVYLYIKTGIKFTPVAPNKVFETLKEGFHYFISAFSLSIYSYSNSAVLAFFTNYESVGLYSIVEKIMQASKQILIVYSQVVHPAACRIADKSYTEYKRFLFRAFIPFFTVFTIFCFGLFLWAPLVSRYFNASDVAKAAFLTRILVFALIITCANIPAYLSLLALHLPKSYSLVFVISSGVSIVLNIMLTYIFGLTGTVINILITEFLITLGLHLTLQLKHKKYALFNL